MGVPQYELHFTGNDGDKKARDNKNKNKTKIFKIERKWCQMQKQI